MPTKNFDFQDPVKALNKIRYQENSLKLGIIEAMGDCTPTDGSRFPYIISPAKIK